MEHNCVNCPIRAKYDTNPKSLIGRFWRWHINFCPGWKAYYQSLGVAEQQKLQSQYHFKKK